MKNSTPRLTKFAPALARRFVIMVIAVSVIWQVGIIALFLTIEGDVITSLPILYVSFAAMGVLGILSFRLSRQVQSAINTHHVHCGECLYPLSRSDSLVRCPECGTAYQVNLLIDYWRWLADRNRHIDHLFAVILVSAATGAAIIAFVTAAFVMQIVNQPTTTGIFFAALTCAPAALIGGALSAPIALNVGYRRHQQRDGNDDSTDDTQMKPPLHWDGDVLIPSRKAWEAQQSLPHCQVHESHQ